MAAASAAKLGPPDAVIGAHLLLFIFLKLVGPGILVHKVALTVFATKCIHLVREGKGSLFSEARTSKGNYGLSTAPEKSRLGAEPGDATSEIQLENAFENRSDFWSYLCFSWPCAVFA